MHDGKFPPVRMRHVQMAREAGDEPKEELGKLDKP